MSSLAQVLRHGRRLSTAASGVEKSFTISQAKFRLKRARSAEEALRIYASTSSNNEFSSAVRYVQGLVVRRLALSHRFEEIEKFLESHKSQPQVTQEAFVASLIRAYGSVGLIDNAVKTYEEMPELGTPRSSLSFNVLLNACVQSKALDRVPVYFSEFPSKYGFSPDELSYGILIKSYCEMGKLDLAVEKLKEMEEKGFQIGVVTFSTILHTYYKNGMNNKAENFWNEMVTKKGLQPDVGSYNVKLAELSQKKKSDDVKALIDEMKNKGLEPDCISFNYLITSYCLQGNMSEAKKVYNDLVKTKGIRPNSATYRTLVFHLCKGNDFIAAYKIFKESWKVRKMPDFNTSKYLFTGLVNEGHINEARAMIRGVRKVFPAELVKAWDKLEKELNFEGEGEGEGEGEDESESAVEEVGPLETEKASV